MDTRDKITNAAAIPRQGTIRKLVVGYFDPLLARHAQRLKELCPAGERVIVAVDDPPDPLLSSRARQELVAALACVAFVIGASEIQELEPDEILDERGADLTLRESLVAQVVGARQP